MSADLLAEFGQTKAPANVSVGRQASNKQTASLFDDLDQETGTFGSSQSLHTGAPNAQFTSETSWQTATNQNYELPTPQHSDVLFDAAFDAPASDTEDDWGEFEGPASSTPAAPQPVAPPQSKVPSDTRNRTDKIMKPTSGTIDLLDSLSIQDSAPASSTPLKVIENREASRVNTDQAQSTWDDNSFDDWGDFADAPSRPRHQLGQSMETPLTEPPTKTIRKTPQRAPENKKPVSSTWDDASFDDWGDFTDGPVVQPVPKPRTTPTPPVSSPSPSSFTSGATTPAATVRPTNIPPPSVLLELFLDVFGELHKEATHAKSQLRSQTSPTPSTPSTPSVSTAASNIHNALQSAARVIAGRSLRWKRDTILSQSMRIGPARSGKAGGMKLNSVNKQENIKEEQDAVDVLIAWRERAAIFNTVLQGAGQRPIPAVSDPSALKVITARTDQGALKASHPCALCSLKRDERVLRVDEQNVQDSFGEWWTEHWGHTACRQFWEANRFLLGQR
ncbi:unnamed protein product [Penicillium salamii]|uniref:Serine/threonine-protein kinase ppk6 n=1 Tax=Penicillium salamii TaxID=1612424 RepID=A0A9W4NHE2_9EURO|nr:unnamed protein product [Penicillium salamii]CAG8263697.1 unnamed protein product [Penicillium salamii]CAG8318225.1 unnamed protein product [Penicillium salamii]CAG8367016.1 unnamed protein product [Penicillium salamii]CAG8391124.1 unnamed protein product [Penicillium salamii]